MKKTVLIYGLILGSIITAHMIYMVNQCYNNPNLNPNDALGYAAMIGVFSLTFFGIKNYRDKQLGGAITLGQAFKTGALIAVVASTIYVGVWVIYYYLFVPDFMDKYALQVINKATREGATAIELAAKADEMNNFKEMYKNPVFVVLISYTEILPVGLVVAFISSLFLKKKPVA